MEQSLGTVLVIGGCGCVGFHVVKALLQDSSCSSVHVFSRNPNLNLLDNVQYYAGSLTSVEDIRTILQKIQPKVIFHVASPISSGNNANNKLFYNTNVLGTKHLLDCARNTPTVKAVVHRPAWYRSHTALLQRTDHLLLTLPGQITTQALKHSQMTLCSRQTIQRVGFVPYAFASPLSMVKETTR